MRGDGRGGGLVAEGGGVQVDRQQRRQRLPRAGTAEFQDSARAGQVGAV
jgi:hypothetical protein